MESVTILENVMLFPHNDRAGFVFIEGKVKPCLHIGYNEGVASGPSAIVLVEHKIYLVSDVFKDEITALRAALVELAKKGV